MSEPTVRQTYEDVPYRQGAFAQTHPARLAAIARLSGQGAVDPRQARVLEIGCGHGLNLLPLAAMFPGAQFTGVDLIEAEIAAGRELVAAAGLTNLRLEAKDVRELVLPEKSFDYIIVHAVFSHVPDEVKDAILARCGRALAPHGVAYISYNTYPGWKTRESLRDLLKFRLHGVEEPEARFANARATLGFLRDATAEVRTPAVAAMRAQIAAMEQTDRTIFYHDELGAVNDPCYLLQFTDWAGRHGLRYLGDAQLVAMSLADLPPGLVPALGQLAPDPLLAEQMMDYVRQRTFRCSLLTRADAPPAAFTPGALREFAFGSPLRAPVAVPDLRAGRRTRFTLPGGGQGLETGDPATKALLSVLADVWPRRIPFDQVLAATRRLLVAASADVPEQLAERLMEALLDLARRGLVDFLLACGLDATTTVGAAPETDRVARTLAAKGLFVVNPWHENVPLDRAMREILPRLDGTPRTWTPDEQAALARLARTGLLRA